MRTVLDTHLGNFVFRMDDGILTPHAHQFILNSRTHLCKSVSVRDKLFIRKIKE